MYDRIEILVHWLVTVLPATVLLLFSTLALRVRYVLGRWPVEYQDNVDDRLATVLDDALYYLVPAVLFSAPLWALLWYLGHRKKRRQWIQIVVYLGGWALLILAPLVDQTGFFAWWLD